MGSPSALALALLITLPVFAADLPDGPGKDVVASACTTCHTVDRIVALKQTKEGWRITVRQMEEEGASFNSADVETIVAYLVNNFGPNSDPPATAAGPVSFNRDIRPIMSRTCFRCHGPDASSRRANMRLDQREDALKPKARSRPIVPGDPEKSEIVQRIFASDALVMPPASANLTLTPAEKETIRRWIAEGARYEEH
jgi:mono/diheme cytochrome c family protein